MMVWVLWMEFELVGWWLVQQRVQLWMALGLVQQQVAVWQQLVLLLLMKILLLYFGAWVVCLEHWMLVAW